MPEIGFPVMNMVDVVPAISENRIECGKETINKEISQKRITNSNR